MQCILNQRFGVVAQFCKNSINELIRFFSQSDEDETGDRKQVKQSSQAAASPPEITLVVQDQRGIVQDPKEQFISQVAVKLTAAKVRGQAMFEPCLVVTSHGIFVLKCARDPVTTFLECAMQGDIKTAEHTASTFDLDGRGLLELVRSHWKQMSQMLSKNNHSGGPKTDPSKTGQYVRYLIVGTKM